MGCGESKHAIVIENTTVPKNKRSLSSKSNSTEGETQENVKKIENGEFEVLKISDEKVKVTADKVEEIIALKVVAVEQETAKKNSKKKEIVELEKATDEVVEKKDEKIVESQPKEKKNANDEITLHVAAVVEKKESVQDIKAEEKTEEIIKAIEEEKEKEEVTAASETINVAKPGTDKDVDNTEIEENAKEENATEKSGTTDSKTY